MRYLGTIAIPNGASRNNTTTAAPFLISSTRAAIWYRASTTTLYFVSQRSNATIAAPSTLAATAATGHRLQLIADFQEQLQAGFPGGWVVAVWNDGGAPATVDVWDEG